MAIDNGKLQEEEASSVTRFYNIILGWDYKQLTKENEVLHHHTTNSVSS
jgi:senataxin